MTTTWKEASQTFLSDGPPKLRQHEAFLFVNTCEVRERKSGTRYLRRSVGLEIIQAANKEELERRVGEFCLRDDVRLLAAGLEANDFDLLPREVNDSLCRHC